MVIEIIGLVLLAGASYKIYTDSKLKAALVAKAEGLRLVVSALSSKVADYEKAAIGDIKQDYAKVYQTVRSDGTLVVKAAEKAAETDAKVVVSDVKKVVTTVTTDVEKAI